MNDKRTVLVIGSNSFSGSDFIDLLLERGVYSVIGCSRSPEKSAVFLRYKRHPHPDYEFHQLDLNADLPGLIELIQARQPDFIVNFAAQSEVAPSWENPQQWFQTNAVAVTGLAHALKDLRFLKKYVHISSPEVYGTCVGTVREDAPLNPSTPYAASKAAGDLSLFTYVKNFGLPLVMTRSTNVYGAHQQLFKIIPRSVINIKLGRRIELHGGGVAVKSYIHIRDISRGELSAMENGEAGRIYHLSPDGGIAVREVVRMLCERLGRRFEDCVTVTTERLGQDAAYVIDSSRARTQLGWRPNVSIEAGLQEVIGWGDRYWEEIKALPHHYVHQP